MKTLATAEARTRQAKEREHEIEIVFIGSISLVGSFDFIGFVSLVI